MNNNNKNFNCCSLGSGSGSGSCSFLLEEAVMGASADAKIAASNKSHSEAERRRRKRINAHLSTLRTLVSNTIKGDKASLLEEVVRSIKELTGEVQLIKGKGKGDLHNLILLPTETDELELCYNEHQDSGIIQASLCCDDRPEILADINRALTSVEAKVKVVRAEMATMGGRTKAVLWLQSYSCGGGAESAKEKLKRALKIVIDKSILLPDAGLGYDYKRPRLYHC